MFEENFFKYSTTERDLKVQLRSVSFNDIVTVYPLIKPQYIYFAKRKQQLQLNDNQMPVFKTFRSISGMHFCSCNKYRLKIWEIQFLKVLNFARLYYYNHFLPFFPCPKCVYSC